MTASAGGTSGTAQATVIDTTPPVISNVDSSNITTDGASIIWNTDEPADSQVEYGVTSDYGNNSPADLTLAMEHNVSLPRINPGNADPLPESGNHMMSMEISPFRETKRFSQLSPPPAPFLYPAHFPQASISSILQKDKPLLFRARRKFRSTLHVARRSRQFAMQMMVIVPRRKLASGIYLCITDQGTHNQRS